MLSCVKYGYWTVTPMNSFMLMKYVAVYCSFYIDEVSLDIFSAFANVAKRCILSLPFLWACMNSAEKMMRGT